DLRRMGAVSYLGVPLLDVDGTVLGHLAVLDQKPMAARPESITVFEIFAGRAAAELRRLRAEQDVRWREEQLTGLVESAMDAIVQLDERLRVVRMNAAAERTFGLSASAALGGEIALMLDAGDAAKFESLAGELSRASASERSRWIAGGLTGRTVEGTV